MTKPGKKAPDQPERNKKNRNKRKSAPEKPAPPNTGQNYVYILLCSDSTLYTGWTNNIDKRLEAHNSGKGAKYTRSRCPVKLVHMEVFTTKEEAMKREAAIKRLTRVRKAALIRENGGIISE